MRRSLLKSLVVSLSFGLSGMTILVVTTGLVHGQPLNVLTVDCTPFISPPGAPPGGDFGPQNTMGLALQTVDQGADFNVTEVTPPAFRALLAAELSAFDVIAVNNHPVRLGDNCVPLAGNGLGTTWPLNWTRLSCQRFIPNQVRLALFVLAYNLGNFLRRLVLPRRIKHWSLRTLLSKLIKIGAKVVRHSRIVTFQMAEVAVSKEVWAEMLSRIDRLRWMTA